MILGFVSAADRTELRISENKSRDFMIEKGEEVETLDTAPTFRIVNDANHFPDLGTSSSKNTLRIASCAFTPLTERSEAFRVSPR